MPENTTSAANPPANLPADPFQLRPIDGPCHLPAVLENLLKQPGRILHELRQGRTGAVARALAVIVLLCLGVYGLVVGTLTGGPQLWIAPAKMALGSLMAGLICLPSLYIFLCLCGVDAHLRQIATALLAAVSLTWLLLLGFAPVAWVFSQSTDSIALMTLLHLIFWAIALWFGLRFLGKGTRAGGEKGGGCLTIWNALYIVVCLQMMTTLRPIIGHADTFLPGEKQFFLAHALQVLAGNGNLPSHQ